MSKSARTCGLEHSARPRHHQFQPNVARVFHILLRPFRVTTGAGERTHKSVATNTSITRNRSLRRSTRRPRPTPLAESAAPKHAAKVSDVNNRENCQRDVGVRSCPTERHTTVNAYLLQRVTPSPISRTAPSARACCTAHQGLWATVSPIPAHCGASAGG